MSKIIANNQRGILASVAVIAVIGLVLAAALYLPLQSTAKSRATSSSLGSGIGSGSAVKTATTSLQFSIVGADCKVNCTIDVPWTSIYHMYGNVTDLTTNSNEVLLANITSENAVLADGIPITEYNITVIEDVLGNTQLQPGMELGPILQVGGTAGGVTMNIKGEPLLSVGGTYVLFLSVPGGIEFYVGPGSSGVAASQSTTAINGTTITLSNSATASYRHSPGDPLAQYVLPADDGDAQITVGGPQGIFHVTGGHVYSLDNANPQDDSWLPLKVSGTPLTQFIQEIQAAMNSVTTSSATSTSTSLAAPNP